MISKEKPENIGKLMGPGSVDSLIRQAINQCWLTFPDEKKSVGAIQAEIRRIVERALRDLEEDATAFGIQ